MKRLFFAFLLIICVFSDDLLLGNGTFTNQTIANWRIVNNSNTVMYFNVLNDSSTQNGSYLQIHKPSDSTLNFQDGLQFNYTYCQVQQITFYFDSMSVNTEDTNLRIQDVLFTGKTVLSFRLGYNGFVRVNENQVIAYYNSTVINSTMFPIWTRADIFFDWTDQLVSVYLNGTYEGNAFFYDTQPLGANSILLYGLTPGSTGFFKNITICHVNCDKSAAKLMFSLGSLLLILVAILLV